MEELIAFKPDQFASKTDTPEVAGYDLSWYDSVRFCRWLSQQAGLQESEQAYADPRSLGIDDALVTEAFQVNAESRDWPLDLSRSGFRFPTEMEWEIAARSGTSTPFGFGSDATLLPKYAWFVDNAELRVHPPKALRPNMRGLFDMHGNQFEWVHDWYSDGKDAIVTPTGPSEGSTRIFRGGGWRSIAAYCRSADRSSSNPSSLNRGLRLARTLGEDPNKPDSAATPNVSSGQ
jgi:formylglycine-generating enzyme required for sulfatase activity